MESSAMLRPCAGNKFCVNTEGSFRCMRCDKSCDGCDGDGPDNCAKCGDGYVKNKVQYLCIQGGFVDKSAKWPLSRLCEYYVKEACSRAKFHHDSSSFGRAL